MIKNAYIKSLLALIILAAAVLFASCANYLDEEYSEASYLRISVSNANARNVSPDISLSSFSDFVLTGTCNGKTKELGKWDNLSDLSSASISLEAGQWALLLTAKKNKADFSASTNVTVESGKTVTASFTLSNVTTGNGSVNITVNYHRIFGIKSAEVNLFQADRYGSQNSVNFLTSSDVNFTSTKLSFAKEVAAGNYLLIIHFYDKANGHEGDKVLGSYCEYITVSSGLETKASFDVDFLEEVAAFSEAKSIENGIQFELDIPADIKSVAIRRREVLSSTNTAEDCNSWWWGAGDYEIEVSNKTSSPVTKTIQDHYGIKMGKTYQYAIKINDSYYAPKTLVVNAENNGWDKPVLTLSQPSYNEEKGQLSYTKAPTLEFKNGEAYAAWVYSQAYVKRNSNDTDWDWAYGWYPQIYDTRSGVCGTIAPDSNLTGILLKLHDSTLYLANSETLIYKFRYQADEPGMTFQQTVYRPNYIEEKDDGIEIEIPVNQGVKNIEILRAISNGNSYSEYSLIGSYSAKSGNSSKKTVKFLDKYGYKKTLSTKYRIRYDGQYFDGGKGIEIIPQNDAPEAPSVNSIPVPAFAEGRYLKFSGSGTASLVTSGNIDLSKIWIQFCYKYEDTKKYIDWKLNDKTTELDLYLPEFDEKTISFDGATLYYDFENDGESFSSAWVIPSDKLASMPQTLSIANLAPKATLETSPSASFTDGVYTITSSAVYKLKNIPEGVNVQPELKLTYTSEETNPKSIDIIDDGASKTIKLYEIGKTFKLTAASYSFVCQGQTYKGVVEDLAKLTGVPSELTFSLPSHVINKLPVAGFKDGVLTFTEEGELNAPGYWPSSYTYGYLYVNKNMPECQLMIKREHRLYEEKVYTFVNSNIINAYTGSSLFNYFDFRNPFGDDSVSQGGGSNKPGDNTPSWATDHYLSYLSGQTFELKEAGLLIEFYREEEHQTYGVSTSFDASKSMPQEISFQNFGVPVIKGEIVETGIKITVSNVKGYDNLSIYASDIVKSDDGENQSVSSVINSLLSVENTTSEDNYSVIDTSIEAGKSRAYTFHVSRGNIFYSSTIYIERPKSE